MWRTKKNSRNIICKEKTKSESSSRKKIGVNMLSKEMLPPREEAKNERHKNRCGNQGLNFSCVGPESMGGGEAIWKSPQAKICKR